MQEKDGSKGCNDENLEMILCITGLHDRKHRAYAFVLEEGNPDHRRVVFLVKGDPPEARLLVLLMDLQRAEHADDEDHEENG